MILQSGPQPAVLVWDCANLAFISELKGHLYGVECIAFSPDGSLQTYNHSIRRAIF